jgi:hypothetical protein
VIVCLTVGVRGFDQRDYVSVSLHVHVHVRIIQGPDRSTPPLIMTFSLNSRKSIRAGMLASSDGTAHGVSRPAGHELSFVVVTTERSTDIDPATHVLRSHGDVLNSRSHINVDNEEHSRKPVKMV